MPDRTLTPATLERISVTVPERALEAYERAIASVCDSVGFFRDDTTGQWLIEGVTRVGRGDAELLAALTVAEMLSGISASPNRERLAPEDWVARSYASFPEQCIGRRFAVRGSHIADPPRSGRITLRLDAGLAFGSGEHGSTSGCLRALEHVAHLRPRRILDLGTGSGILAIAAARLLHRPVAATDIDPWSVRLARQNAQANGVGRLIRFYRADGWRDPRVRQGAPYDLVLANILARPLMLMAAQLAAHLAPGGTVILSGLLATQAPGVLAAHRARGLRLRFRVKEQTWTTLVMRTRRT
ncbi:MAG TPA: 50S ribosomal protein L11 methyltransferase [Acetobacteraceae bacterium]|nr:50S ribosomal protein L11 methyltransferase [Acetobacteraceae bacterium]